MINLPYVSLQFPTVDFSGLGKAGAAVGVGYSNRRLKRAMEDPANGVIKPDGTLDYEKAAKVITMDRPWEGSLIDQYGGGDGAGGFGLNTTVVEDPDNPGQFIAIQAGRGGDVNVVKDPQGKPYRPLTQYRYLPDGRGGYFRVPSKGGVGNLITRSDGQQFNDEPAETFYGNPQGNPTNETDPQIPEAVDPGPEWDPFTGGGEGDALEAGDVMNMRMESGNPDDTEILVDGLSVNPDRTTPPTKEPQNVDEAVGDIKGKALQSVPGYENSLKEMLRTLNLLENHPNLNQVTGAIQGGMTPLTETQAEVQSLIDLVTAKQWMQAFETLKGGGSITVEEGLSAAKAMSRLGQQRVGTPAYKEAIRDARRQLWDLYNVLRRKAGLAPMKNPFESNKGKDSKVIDYREWFGM